MLYYDRIDIFEGNNVNQMSVVFSTIGIIQIFLSFNQMSVIGATMYC